VSDQADAPYVNTVTKLTPDVGDTVKDPGDGGAFVVIRIVFTDVKLLDVAFTTEHVSARVNCAPDGSCEAPITRFSGTDADDDEDEEAATTVLVDVSAMDDSDNDDDTVVTESSNDHTQSTGEVPSSMEANTDTLDAMDMCVNDDGDVDEMLTLGHSSPKKFTDIEELATRVSRPTINDTTHVLFVAFTSPYTVAVEELPYESRMLQDVWYVGVS
jgi:hypothetical protein